MNTAGRALGAAGASAGQSLDSLRQGVASAINAGAQALGPVGTKVAAAGLGTAIVLGSLGVAGVAIAKNMSGGTPDHFPTASARCAGVIPDKSVVTGELPNNVSWRVALDDGAAQAGGRQPLAGSTVQELCQLQVDTIQDGTANLEALGQNHSSDLFPDASRKQLQQKIRADWVAEKEVELILDSQLAKDPALSPSGTKAGLTGELAALKSDQGNASALGEDFRSLLEQEAALQAGISQLQQSDPDQARQIVQQGELSPDAAYPDTAAVLKLKVPTKGDLAQQAAALQALQVTADAQIHQYLPQVSRAMAGPTWQSDHPAGDPSADFQAKVLDRLKSAKSLGDVNAFLQENELAYRQSPGVWERHQGTVLSQDAAPQFAQMLPILGGPDQGAKDLAQKDWKAGKSDDQLKADETAYVIDLRGQREVAVEMANLKNPPVNPNTGNTYSDGWCDWSQEEVNEAATGTASIFAGTPSAEAAYWNARDAGILNQYNLSNMPPGTVVFLTGGYGNYGHAMRYSGLRTASGDPIMYTSTGFGGMTGLHLVPFSTVMADLTPWGLRYGGTAVV